MSDTMFLIRMDDKGITCKTWRVLVYGLMSFINKDNTERYSIFEVYKIDYHKPDECEVTLDCAYVKLACDEYVEIKKIIYPLSGDKEYVLDTYKVRMDYVCEAVQE
jgi:hypothetical protein